MWRSEEEVKVGEVRTEILCLKLRNLVLVTWVVQTIRAVANSEGTQSDGVFEKSHWPFTRQRGKRKERPVQRPGRAQGPASTSDLL